MIVYHASYCIIERPDISFSRVFVDFGPGFYVTSLRDQAINYAARFLKNNQRAYLNQYNLDDSWSKKRIKRFNSYNKEWLDFVVLNRQGKTVSEFDAVEGGVANDRVFRTLELYLDGDISKAEALKRLRYEKPNHQICFCTQQMIDEYLHFIASEEVI